MDEPREGPKKRVEIPEEEKKKRSRIGMDIRRDEPKSKKKYVYIGLGLVAVAAITVALSRLEPAAPSVDKATVFTDVVKRGEMLRRVRGPGTLVPEQARWISALTAGRIERKLLEPGIEVDRSTVLLEMSNPDVEIQALEAQRQLTAARAGLADLRTRLQSQRLQQESQLATVEADYRQAMRTVKNNEELAERGLISEVELENSRDRAEELETRVEAERKRLAVLKGSVEEQLEVQRSQVERLEAISDFQQGRVASMRVVAGVDGVLSELPLEEGQWVTPGETLARVVKPGRLKAELRIPETQAREVAVGQPALIDTRNDTIQGRVVRIDPAVQNGTVTVDVKLESPLPDGARPDLSVDGTIEIERLTDVLYVGRPAYGQANSTVGLFKVVENGNAAIRVNVQLGRSSVNTIEIRNGLQVGDEVILSDMSAWDSYDRVRLK